MVLQWIKAAVILVLRYVFLAGLVVYHWFKNVWNSATGSLEPIQAEARKLPASEITLGGIVRTLTRAAFLCMLLGYHYVKMAADIVITPISNWLNGLRQTLGIPDNQLGEPLD